jgi:RNA polymerase primary sigma factor
LEVACRLTSGTALSGIHPTSLCADCPTGFSAILHLVGIVLRADSEVVKKTAAFLTTETTSMDYNPDDPSTRDRFTVSAGDDQTEVCLAAGAASPSSPAPPGEWPSPDNDQPDSEERGGSTFHIYLREIRRIKLLSLEEEATLARRIQQGDTAAREHMIKANLRLVVKIARRFEGLGLPLLDLISEGNIGLMNGVERFDPTRGTRLSSYASVWIKQRIFRALSDHSRTVRLPVSCYEECRRIDRVADRLRETLEREPTEVEIANEIDLSAARIRRLREAAQGTVSLDGPQFDDELHTLAESVMDTSAASPEDSLHQVTCIELVREHWAELTARQQYVLQSRFGLDGVEGKTLKMIGDELGLTREAIRQIQDRALKKLRWMIRRRDLETSLARVKLKPPGPTQRSNQ